MKKSIVILVLQTSEKEIYFFISIICWISSANILQWQAHQRQVGPCLTLFIGNILVSGPGVTLFIPFKY